MTCLILSRRRPRESSHRRPQVLSMVFRSTRGTQKSGVNPMPEETPENDDRLQLAAQGDPSSWEALVEESRPRLRRMVAFRLDQRLQGRIDPSDVLQDAYLAAWEDLGAYLDRPAMPFFLWLRGIAGNKLRELHRHHLGTQMRAPRREVSIHGGALAETTTGALAARLLADLSRASGEVVRAEVQLRLQDALNTMEPLDREVLALR